MQLGYVLQILNVDERRKAEMALQESESRFRTLIEQIPDVTWTSDEEGKTHYISPNVERVYGYTQEEIYEGGDALFFGRIHPDDKESVMKAYQEMIESGTKYDIEYRIQRKDGQWIWLHDRSLGTYERDATRFASGIFEDITSLKETEIALKESEEKYRTLVRQIPSVLITTDAKGVTHYVSPQIEDLMGYTPEEYYEKEPLDRIHPDDVEEVIKRMTLLFEEGKEFHVKYRAKRKDGEWIWVDVKAIETYEREGQQLASGIITDITNQMKAEKALQESEEKYRTLIENMQDGIVIIQGEKITFTNDIFAEYLGYSLEEIEGSIFTDFIAPEDEEWIAEEYAQRTIGEQEPVEYEIRLLKKSGDYIYVRSKAVNFDYQGKLTTISTIADITSQKEMLATLEQSEKKFRDLFQNAQVAMFRTSITSGEIIECNELAAELLGYDSPGEAIDDYFASEHYVDSETRQILLAQLNEKGEVSHFQAEITDRHGNPIWVDFSSKLHPDEGFLESVVVNITERKKAEDALKESEEKFRGIIEHISEIFHISDRKGDIIYISPGVKEVLGYEADEFLEEWKIYLTDNPINQRGIEILEHTLSTGEKSDPYLHEFFHKDGSKRLIETNESPLLDEEGHVIGIIGVARDITEKKRTEEALRESEERYRTLIEKIPVVSWSVSKEGSVRYVSPNIKKVQGFSQEEIYESPDDSWTGAIHPDDFDKVMDEFTQLFESGKEYNVEYRLKSKDGSWRWVRDRATGTYELNGELVATGIVYDITETVMADEALSESERKYRLLFESASDAIFLMKDSKFIECNSATLEMFGCAKEQILGKTPWKFSPRNQPDGKTSKQKALERIEAAIAGKPQLFEWRHKKLDGTLFDAIVSLDKLVLGEEILLQAIVREKENSK
jgi:PAS domain S-box-containing protein